MSTKLLNKEHLATPSELQFPFMAHTRGLVAGLQTKKYWPISGIGQEFRANDTIRFQLAGHNAVDLRSLRLCFKAKIEDTTNLTEDPAATPGDKQRDYAKNFSAPGMYASGLTDRVIQDTKDENNANHQDVFIGAPARGTWSPGISTVEQDRWSSEFNEGIGEESTFLRPLMTHDLKDQVPYAWSEDSQDNRNVDEESDARHEALKTVDIIRSRLLTDTKLDDAKSVDQIEVALSGSGQGYILKAGTPVPWPPLAASAKVSWFADHGSCVIRTLTVNLNATEQIERIDRYNRVRGLLSELSIDEAYKASWGQSEGYQPRYRTKQNSGITDKGSVAGKSQTVRIDDQAKDRDYYSRMHPSMAFIDSADRRAAWDHGMKTCQSYYHPEASYTSPALNTLSLGDDDGANAIDTYVKYKPADSTDDLYIDGKKTEAAFRWKPRSTQFSIPLDLSGFLSQRKIVSLPAVGSIDLELTLEQDSVVINHIKKKLASLLGSDRDNLSYVLDDVYIVVDTMDLSPAYNEALANALFSSGINFDFPTYEVYTPSIRNTTAQLQVHRRLSDLKTVWVFFADKHLISGSGTTDTAPTNDRINKTTNFPSFNLNSYNLLIDGVPVTSHVIDTKPGENAEAMHELAKSLRLHGDNLLGSRFNADSYEKDLFAIGVDMEKNSLMSGKPMQTMQLDLVFDSANTHTSFSSDITAFVVLHFSQRVIVQSGARVQVIN